MSKRFTEHLKNQLRFINLSCKSFDKGFLEESLRLSVCIRVIFHNTRNSTSILKHLDKENINVLSSCGENRNEDVQNATFLESLIMFEGGKGLRPMLNDGPAWCYEEIYFSEWWNQIVLITNEGQDKFSRKSLILNLANKDGGAHVDENLDLDYERLKDGYWIYPNEVDGEEIDTKFEDPHYLHVRQIAWEILNSKDLLSLIE
ncbi:MAG: hypothetical protein K9I94_12525 [Bacteroidales bacterium]|nr:hypothetical protein [Bacteroidales bacterium]